MKYIDKSFINEFAERVAKQMDLNILCQFGVLNGKNTASITVDGEESLFTSYEACKAYLSSLFKYPYGVK